MVYEMFLEDLFPYPLLYPKFVYFCHAAKPKGQAEDILKERRCLTLYLRQTESRKFQPYRMVKQWLTPMYLVYTSVVYLTSVGFGIAYPR